MAIAFDAANSGSAVGTTDVTVSHTASGANPILFAFVDVTTGSATPTVTANGVAMTFIDKRQIISGSNETISLFYKSGLTGTFNVIAEKGGNNGVWRMKTLSYSGAAQTGIPDNSVTAVSAATTDLSGTLTTVADSCWFVGGYVNADTQNISAGAGTTARSGAASMFMVCDNNAAISPPASTTLHGTASNSAMAFVGASFAPLTTNIKTFNGNAYASTKTVNGLALGSTKSWNGLQ